MVLRRSWLMLCNCVPNLSGVGIGLACWFRVSCVLAPQILTTFFCFFFRFAEHPNRRSDAAGSAVRHLFRAAVPARAVDADYVRGQHGAPVQVLGGARQPFGELHEDER